MPQITIERKRMKYMRIKVNSDGTVIVSAPKYISQAEITRFVDSKRDRIAEKQKLFRQRKSELSMALLDHQMMLHGEAYTVEQGSRLSHSSDSSSHSLVLEGHRRALQAPKVQIDHSHKLITTSLPILDPKTQEQRYKSYAKTYLTQRVAEIADLHELDYRKVIIRNAKTNRWTCSSTKNIWLNWRLVKMPETMSDYIICHELAHLLEMNHSKNFWAVVDTLYGEKKAAIQRLKKYGLSLY